MSTITAITEFRVTRAELYETPDCLGKNDLTARQGHYICADSPHAAAEKLQKFLKKCGQLREGERRFDVQVWKQYGRYVGSQNAIRINLMS